MGSTVVLSSLVLGQSSLGALQLYAEGTFTLHEAAALVLAPGGRLLASAGQVRIDGQVTAPGGSISLETLLGTQADIDLGAKAVLSTGRPLVCAKTAPALPVHRRWPSTAAVSRWRLALACMPKPVP